MRGVSPGSDVLLNTLLVNCSWTRKELNTLLEHSCSRTPANQCLCRKSSALTFFLGLTTNANNPTKIYVSLDHLARRVRVDQRGLDRSELEGRSAS